MVNVKIESLTMSEERVPKSTRKQHLTMNHRNCTGIATHINFCFDWLFYLSTMLLFLMCIMFGWESFKRSYKKKIC